MGSREMNYEQKYNEDYVRFETAKLLKEKGFDWECSCYYFFNDEAQFEESLTHWDWNNGYTFRYSAPTLQMAMKWLREVHRLHVEVVPHPFNFEHQDIQDGWGCEVTHLSDLSYDGNYEFFQKKYSTYEEACEAAIKYCLENLI